MHFARCIYCLQRNQYSQSNSRRIGILEGQLCLRPVSLSIIKKAISLTWTAAHLKEVLWADQLAALIDYSQVFEKDYW